MQILVVGGAGMLGRKLAERLARDGALGDRADLPRRRSSMSWSRSRLPAPPSRSTPSSPIWRSGAWPATCVASRPDVVFHLAAVVSGEAEADFEKGYRVNLDGTRPLLDGVRAIGEGYRPRVVFTSSIAVFGAPFPEVIGDDHALTPLTSYGTQKAIGELLLSDYTRRGFLDGVGIRLPTICVRPGAPNRAASGFFSSIIREPLNGRGGGAAGARRRASLASPRRARRSASSSTRRRSTPARSATAAA